MSEWARQAAARSGWGNLLELPAQAASDPREELIVSWSEGTGTFSDDQKFLSIQADVYLLETVRRGSWSGIFELVEPLASAFRVPPPAPPPFNLPQGPIPQPPPAAFGKARWDFGDGDSITVEGPAVMSATVTSVLETGLWISANHLISVGTGRYEGAQGTKTALVSIWLPQGQSVREARDVRVKTFDGFRVVRKEFIGEPPPLPEVSS